MLRAVDVFHRLDFADMTAVPEASLPVPMELAMRGMPMRTRRGRALHGFPAVRRALSQTALGPVGWAMYVPGVSQIAAAVYGQIAANRKRDCALPAMPTLAGAAPPLRPPVAQRAGAESRILGP